MKIKLLLSFLILSMFLSCKKDVSEEMPELIGNWQTMPGSDFFFTIDIDSANNAAYKENGYSGHGNAGSFEGKAKVSENKLKIGNHTFEFVELPHKIDTANSTIYIHNPFFAKKANWKMSLKGTKFYMGEGDYYKADY